MPLVEIARQGQVAVVTLNRPDKLNALNGELIAELAAALPALEKDVRAAILTGAGKAFAAGADIAAMVEMTPQQALAFARRGHALCAQLEAAPFAVIAAVHGYALGGGLEVALACDFIYAAEGAKLGQPEVSLAVIPGFGGTQRLMRRVGIARARELIYAGKMLTADEAARIGLVNEVAPAAELLPRAQACAAQIAKQGPLAIQAAKRALLHGQAASLGDACELEMQAFAALFGSADQRAGMKAFVDKRKAEFAGQ